MSPRLNSCFESTPAGEVGAGPNVLRDRLVEKLQHGLASGRRLTLISAPAGFGKTTVVSEWLDPAELEVDYPKRLSRGLVLVKWVLAIPHLIIVALIAADLELCPWSGGTATTGQPASAYSILNMLVVIAGVFLLITGAYPRSLFDFVMGSTDGCSGSSSTSRSWATSTRPSGSMPGATRPPHRAPRASSPRSTPPAT